MLWKDAKRELIIKNADIERGTPALVADTMARGFWDRQSAMSFDIRAMDTDAPSHLTLNPMSIFNSAGD